MSGTNDLIVAGGVQNMSMIPISSAMTVAEPLGFTDPFSASTGWVKRYGDQEISQFRGAEMIAEKWDISREDMEVVRPRAPPARARGPSPRVASSTEIVPFGEVSPSTRVRGRTRPSRRWLRCAPLVEGGRLTAAVSSQISDARDVDADRVGAGGEGPRPDAPGPHPPPVSAAATIRS